MTYLNWSQAFGTNPNNDAYDKNMAKVGDPTIVSPSANDCIDNAKKAPNLQV